MERGLVRWLLGGIFVLILTGGALLLRSASAGMQAALLVHVAVGSVILPLVFVYVALHAKRLWRKDRGGSRTVAVVATAATLGVTASGAFLVLSYVTALGAAPMLRSVHFWSAAFAVVLLPVHAIASLARRSSTARSLSLGRLALGSSLAGLLAVACVVQVVKEDRAVLLPVGPEYPRTADGGVFSASFTRTAHGGFVEARALTGSEACGACHEEIYREWSVSTHRFSGIDNPLIFAATEPAEKNAGLKAARFCASCHEPVALLSGKLTESTFTVPAAYLQQGVTCLVCHGVGRVPGRRGNGEMVYSPPDTLAFFNTGSRWAAALNRLLIQSFVERHRRAMRPSLLDNSHQCSSCHTVNAHEGLNGIGFIRLHNDNDDWDLSVFSHGVGPDGRIVRCQDCHMGNEAGSHDPVAKRKGGVHRSHRFIAANTFVAKNFGDAEQLRRTERFLQGVGFPEEIREFVPQGPPVTVSIEAPETASRGARMRLAVVLSNRGVGHAFPAGPNEVNEAWVELLVRDEQGDLLFGSGQLDPSGDRDPHAFALISIPVDQDGNEVFATGGLSAGFRLRRAILHGASDEQSYDVAIPADVGGTKLIVSARLRYRKSDGPFARLLKDFSIEDVPITDIATAQRTVRLVGARRGRPARSMQLSNASDAATSLPR